MAGGWIQRSIVYRAGDGSIFFLELSDAARGFDGITAVHWRGIPLEVPAFIDELDDDERDELLDHLKHAT